MDPDTVRQLWVIESSSPATAASAINTVRAGTIPTIAGDRQVNDLLPDLRVALRTLRALPEGKSKRKEDCNRTCRPFHRNCLKTVLRERTIQQGRRKITNSIAF